MNKEIFFSEKEALLYLKIEALARGNILRTHSAPSSGIKELGLYEGITENLVAYGNIHELWHSYQYATLKYHFLGKNNLSNKLTYWDENGKQRFEDTEAPALSEDERAINAITFEMAEQQMFNILLFIESHFDVLKDYCKSLVEEFYDYDAQDLPTKCNKEIKKLAATKAKEFMRFLVD